MPVITGFRPVAAPQRWWASPGLLHNRRCSCLLLAYWHVPSSDRPLNFPGTVPEIPFAHDIDERRKLAAVLVVAVNIVGDGNKMNPMLPEHYLRVEAGFQIIPADFTQVSLYQGKPTKKKIQRAEGGHSPLDFLSQ